MLRIGHGYDSHRFTDGTFVTIGGVEIPYSKGVKAHSDGDVLLHAICDALFGAAALGDLGQHFPDTDPAFKAVASQVLLKKTVALLHEQGYRVNNIDATVIAQAPKCAPHIVAMRQHIANVVGIEINQVSVKATTNEKMGWIGAGEGLAAHAVVTIVC